MDFRNLCSKIDVDSIKAKFPQMPAMPHIKIPKSFPKLKSRKIFRSSREEVSKASVKQPKRETLPATLSVPPIQPAGFINRTPTRISTISSLMNEYSTGFRRSASDSIEQYEENTYRSANRIDDDYPSPYSMYGTRYGGGTSGSPEKRGTVRSTSPKMTASSSSVKLSFGEKLQKGYKDFSGFRFKNILTKRTILRRDNIVVDYYVQRYKEDQVVEDREQMSRDQRIADNYRFNFKESRQNTADSVTTGGSDSPTVKKSLRKENESPQNQKIRIARKSVSEKSDDESGMETSPPKRLPKGSAPTHRVEPKRRPLRRDISQNSNPDEHTVEMHESKHAPITSSLWAIKNNQDPRESRENRDTLAGKKGHQERTRRLTNSVSSLEESAAESVTEKSAGGAGYTLPYQQSVDEKVADRNNPVNAIKHNMKRFKSTMSIKHQPPKVPNGSDDEDHRGHDQHNGTRSPPTQRTMKEKLTARLRRLKSGEASSVEDIAKDRNSPKKNEGVENSPLRATFNKFQTWKKALRNKPGYPGAGDDGSPEKQSHSSILIEKLKYIRNRKNPNTADAMESDDGLETEATGEAKKTNVNTMERFEKARHKTFKKMNDKMQKIFHKSQENVGKDIEMEGAPSTTLRYISPPTRRPQRFLKDDDEHSSEDDDIEEIPTKKSEEDYSLKPKMHAVWTTNPILSESTESEDNTKEYPRVLIHQDNSDAFESTLIIAVTTAAPSQKQRITEILPEPIQNTTPKELEWIPNKEIVSGFLKLTPPAERKLSLATIGKKASLTRGHKRNQSMDSNSDSNSDPWIPKIVQKEPLFAISRDFPRCASGAELDSIQESEKPWRVHTMYPKTLYKTHSIDIFGENVKYDGMQEPFEDFDDHLINEPVLKIVRKSYSEDESLSKESSEEPDAGDDDNSSRITKISVGNISEERLLSNSPQFSLNEDYQDQQIGNSRESLDANFDENEEYTDNDYDYDDEGDDDRPPSVAPSPPPFSPPPLPQRQPLMRFARPTVLRTEAVPPLPTSKPPAPPTRPPPQIPERTESMARISKPLVKTSSLRLAYTEQVKPADVGKVNKLISRFEQPTPEQMFSTRSEFNNRDGSEDYSYYKEEDDVDDEIDEESVQTEPEDDINNNDDEESMTTPTNIHPTITIWTQDSLDEGAAGEIVRTTKKRVAPKPEAIRMTTDSTTTEQITTSPSSRDDENNNNNNQSDKLLMVEKQDTVGEIKTPQRNTKCGEINTVKHLNIPKLTVTSDLYSQNIPQSQASSEYGSPLEYPSSLIGSTETTPTPGRKQQQELRTPGRRVRSMVRDDDQYYSFDSDDENSYYSISSVGSNRYVVEI